ncbi:MAG: glycosyltransferase [Desulfurococcales archaeon]|nr:glycosyltransferase [Desulfurococcales archaeon]
MPGGAVLAWSRLARRSRDIARRLGLALYHLNDRPPYLRALISTLRLAPRHDCLILQLPPGPALPGTLLAQRGRGELLCDVHTGMFHYRSLGEIVLNRPFKSLLSRCSRVLAHNEDAARLLEEVAPGLVEVIYDPLPQPVSLEPVEGLEPSRFILLPASWDPDEPISYMAREALKGLPGGLKLVITGKPKGREARRVKELAKSNGNIILAGFQPWPRYYWLVANSAAVIALTTWEYTVLSVVWEAAAYTRPIVASSTATLRNLLGDDATYFRVGEEGSLARALNGLKPEMGKRLSSRLRRLSNESMNRLGFLCQHH